MVAPDAGQQAAVQQCLDRLRPDNKHFQAKRLAFEIRDVGFTPAGTLGTLQFLASSIYRRAVSEPERYAPPCASLCFSLTPILPNFKPPGAVTATAKAKRIDFRQTLLNLCQREFEAACGLAAAPGDATAGTGAAPAPNGTVAGDAAAPAASSPSSATPAVAANGDASAAGSMAGSLTFLAHLYLHHLLTDRIMLACLLTVAAGPSGSGGSGGCSGSGSNALLGPGGRQRLDCLVRVLRVAGQQLDEYLPEKHRPMLEELYDQLRAVQVQDAQAEQPPPELAALLDALLRLRAAGWPAQEGSAASVAARNGKANGAQDAAVPTPAAARALFSKAAAGAPCPSPRAAGAGGLSSAAAGAPAAADAPPAAAPAARAESQASNYCVDSAHPQRVLALKPVQRQVPPACAPAPSLPRGRSSQNLEGLWNLSADGYADVRQQVLSAVQDASAPSTLEALADELVECAVAAAGGDAGHACLGDGVNGTGPRRPSHSGSSGGAAVSDADWAAEVKRQWDAQAAACDIYVRLAVDALQHWSGQGGSGNGADAMSGQAAAAPAAVASSSDPAPGNGVASPAAAAAAGGKPAGPAETGRAFRRLLLSSAQAHFERCLAALLPTAAATATPASGTERAAAGQPAALAAPQPRLAAVASPASPAAAGVASPAASPSPSASPAPSPAASLLLRGGAGGARGLSRRAWADMPVAAPDAAAALPRVRGMCHLLLGLLNHGVLTPRIILHCAAALVDGAAGGSAACLEAACILLAGAGKQAATFKVAEAAAFESLIKRLQCPGVGSEGGNGDSAPGDV